MAPPSDPVYESIAAFAAGLASHGVTDVVISPGSRSTPLSVTLHAQPALRTWIQLDERSAGFFALGMARVTGRPAVLVCTSGTAAANYLPAVVEAHHGGVPMIVCTADRPPELRDWGAGQTIDQVGIYGTATRWAADLPVAGDWTPDQARIAAMRAAEMSVEPSPGPVHLNWPLREPLEPVGAVPVHDVDETDEKPGYWSASIDDSWRDLERGVVVVGPHDGVGLRVEHNAAEAILRFACGRGWPVIAEPLTQLRRGHGPDGALVVTAADHLLKDTNFGAAMVPEVVVRVGRSPTSKPVRLWLEAHPPDRVVLVDPSDHWHDASFTITDHVRTPVQVALARTKDEGPRRSDWTEEWERVEAASAKAIAAQLVDASLCSALIARTIVESVPEGTTVVVSNSMPVRDLDAYVPVAGPPISIVGNRGASGIDGITSTALGVAAASDRPTVAFMGDLALLHDLGALYGAERLGLHLTIVCVDNDGGGIFSMLPIAQRDDVDFETLFRTPHGLDLGALGATGGLRPRVIDSVEALADALRTTTSERRPGVDLLVVPVDRDADLAQRRAITAAVHEAIPGR